MGIELIRYKRGRNDQISYFFLGGSLLGWFLSRLLGRLLGCLLGWFLSRLLGRLLGCLLGWLLCSFLGWFLVCLLCLLGLLCLLLFWLLCLLLLCYFGQLEGTRSLSGFPCWFKSSLSKSTLKSQANLDGSLGSIDLVVSNDVLENSLTGGPTTVLKGCDGSSNHHRVLGVGSRLLSLLHFSRCSVSHLGVVWYV